MDTPKRIGILVAGGMPPPHLLKKSMAKDVPSSSGDEEEGTDEMDSEGEGGSGGMQAFSQMMSAWESGDKAAAYDAFKDVMRICNSEEEKSPEGAGSSTYEG